jgi:outer membrane protein assembly factor BamB
MKIIVTLLLVGSLSAPGLAQGYPTLLHKLLASDGEAGDECGQSVALAGHLILVGARQDDNDNGIDSGSAHIFDAATGQQLHKLTPSDGAFGDSFGWSVSLSGNLALVGACFDDDNGSNSGSAYLFDATTGQQLHKLSPSDGAAGDFFGWSVSLSGNLALVGAFLDDDNGSASGSAYLFDATTGQQLHKLTPSDGAVDDSFGMSVSLSGDLALVGAPLDGDSGSAAGSAYLFDVTTGRQLHKLTANDGSAGDQLGNSVSLSGNLALVGAWVDNNSNGIDSGSAYIFDATIGQQLHKLIPSDGAAREEFGMSVSLSGNLALVGAYLDDDNGSASGSAYLFDATTGHQLHKLTPSDGAAVDFFGWAVSISGTLALVGAPSDDDKGTDSGSAYLFQLTNSSPTKISITSAERSPSAFIINFKGEANITSWKVTAALTGLDGPNSFATDLSSQSIITETTPANYQAVISLNGAITLPSDKCFFRIELP